MKAYAAGLVALLWAGAAFAADEALVEQGRYLATAADCQGCHTVPGETPFAGGREIETPFGQIVAPNITPDTATGIGAWTADQFVEAVQHGIAPRGRHLYPAMPYPYYAKASRDDVLAVFAYLKSLPPVANRTGGNHLPFPLNQRILMIGWNLLFFHDSPFKPDSAKPADWNRGGYLVAGLGHCAACHTPKNVLGGDHSGKALQGGVIQSWHASNLTGDARIGLGSWSAEDVARFLKAGHNRTADAVGSMAEVVNDSTSQLNDADLAAIAAYLKSLPAQGRRTVTPVNSDTPAMRAGQAIFTDNCTACHSADGTGAAELFTPLAASATVQEDNPTSLIRVVLEGAQSPGTAADPTAQAMPSFAWKLSDDQIAAVLTYVRNAWHNAAPSVTPREVSGLRNGIQRP